MAEIKTNKRKDNSRRKHVPEQEVKGRRLGALQRLEVNLTSATDAKQITRIKSEIEVLKARTV